jgi:hypothetical protein
MGENEATDWAKAAELYRETAKGLQGIPGSEKMLADIGKTIVDGAYAAFNAKVYGNPVPKVSTEETKVEMDPALDPTMHPTMDPTTVFILKNALGDKRKFHRFGSKGTLLHIDDAPDGWVSVREVAHTALQGWETLSKDTMANVLRQCSKRTSRIGLRELRHPWVGKQGNPLFFANLRTDQGNCYCYPPGEPTAILHRAVAEVLDETFWGTPKVAAYMNINQSSVRMCIERGQLKALKDDKGHHRVTRLSVRERMAKTAPKKPMQRLIDEAQTILTLSAPPSYASTVEAP